MVAKPSQPGWYWMWHKGHHPSLVEIQFHNKELRVHMARTSMGESWEYISKQIRPTRLEYIGQFIPDRITPKKDGFHWITSRDGSRHIVNVVMVGSIDGPKVWIVGSAYQYSWLKIVEAYEVIRIDFLADADEDYSRSRL